MNRSRILFACLILLGCAVGSWRLGGQPGVPGKRNIHIVARQYAYEPNRFVVQQGDEVHITLSSRDVVHGFYLEGYDIDAEIKAGQSNFSMRHPSYEKEYRPVEEIVFIAKRTGKFRYRCSHTCGYLHPFMLGEMIVAPNRLFPLSVGLVLGMLGAGLALVWPFRGKQELPSEEVPESAA